MKKLMIFPVLMLLGVVLFSFKKSSDFDTKLIFGDESQFYVSSTDLVYNQSTGDFSENRIAAKTASGDSGGIILCPGSGQNCQVVVQIGNDIIVYVAKKTPGGRDYIAN